ncbi:thiamine-binding protein [Shouchella shacheensis]|uniref:thiamine-binding protein n=1 Tax=Shouchella shacheensis TaxID=1649580 RepID=UPI0007404511|nr:thiamine-binding protein [Shouchella shacheensis]
MPTVTAGLQLLPNGKDMDTNGIITKVVDFINDSGMKHEIGAMETVIEGEMDDVLKIIKEAQRIASDSGANEVISNVKIHYRPEGVQIKDKNVHLD